MKKVLVISPHPDDEAIGCGGTISSHIADGDVVEVIFLTSGEKGGHDGKTEKDTRKIREEEARHAATILQLTNIEFWREPDGVVSVTVALVKKLKNKIQEQKTNIIYVTHQDEEHPDHQAAALLVKKAMRKLNQAIEKPAVWMYEVWTPIQRMDHIVDISSYVDLKRKAILAHNSQCSVMKFDEAILGLNRYRGEMHSWPGGEYAEVFNKMKV